MHARFPGARIPGSQVPPSLGSLGPAARILLGPFGPFDGRLAVGAMLLALLLGLIAGCTSTPSTFYTLGATPGPAEPGPPGDSADGRAGLAVAIGPLRLPEFLDRPQIVTRTGPHRLAVDEFHRWGGSLRDDFLRVLGENLGRLLGTSRILVEPADARFPLDFRVVPEVIRFEGGASGEAVLKVRWTVLDPHSGQALAVREGTYRSRAGTADPEAMVAALSETLAAFSRDLAEQLRHLPRTLPLVQLKAVRSIGIGVSSTEAPAEVGQTPSARGRKSSHTL